MGRSFAALRITQSLSAGRLLHCVRNDESDGSKDRSFAALRMTANALRMTTPLSTGRLLHCVRNDGIKCRVQLRNPTYGKDTERIQEGYRKDRSFAALRMTANALGMTTPLSTGRLLHCVRNDGSERQVQKRNLPYGKDTGRIQEGYRKDRSFAALRMTAISFISQ